MHVRPLAEQQRIFNPSGGGRRIIIATNVAGNGINRTYIFGYVIDSGFARISRYNDRSLCAAALTDRSSITSGCEST